MRLDAVRRGNRWPNRMFVRFIERQRGGRAPDIVRAIHYRSGFWGGPWSAALQPAMRGPSEWTTGERELFAAYTSAINQCHF